MYITFRDVLNLGCPDCNQWETDGPWEVWLTSTSGTECLYESLGTVPCNGKLYLVLSCPNPDNLLNQAEVEVHENGVHVASFYLVYHPGLMPCDQNFGDFGPFTATANPLDECAWSSGVKVSVTLTADTELSSGSTSSSPESSSSCCSIQV